ncbi:MAG: metal ABC transporter substrate-binding protein [Oscillospiraceae bacterium]|nr:metal ABC transporter substrate-binding protein [Oscillospiraceae bacterium]
MKRIITTMLSLLLIAALLCGCVPQSEEPDITEGAEPVQTTPEPAEPLNIVCTIFPQYDWTRQILGDRASSTELTLLLDSKVDLHSYQPTIDDILKISAADLFIYTGGESDAWVEAALRENSANPDMITVNLMEILGDRAKLNTAIEGMEDDHDDDDDDDDDDHDDDDDEHYDEHIWLSLKNAGVFCDAITEAISSLDSVNTEEYKKNAHTYMGKLEALDAEYKEVADNAQVKTLLFGDRFPFRYLCDDYGLDYYAAFSGCSAETEASFETIAFLAKKVDELNLTTVMVTESYNTKVAETILKSTADKNEQILTLDAIQSVILSETDNKTYLSIMESNLNVLKEALSPHRTKGS